MEEKKTPVEILIGGVALLVIGIILCVTTGNRVTCSYSS